VIADTLELAALMTTDDGQVVDPATGEIVAWDQVGRDLLGETLRTYARAKMRMDVLRLDLDERVTELTGADPTCARLVAEMDQAQTVVADIEATLASLFLDRRDKVSLDIAGVAGVTWPKARQTWTLARPASWYAGDRARHELSNLVNTTWGETGGYAPTTIGLLVHRVLQWLAPTSKTGELPAPTIRVHGL